MRKVFAISVLVLISSSAFCQGYYRYTRADSVRALQHLFQRKNTGGILRAVLCSGIAIALFASNPTSDPPQPQLVSTVPGGQYGNLNLYYTPAQVTNPPSSGQNAVGGVIFTGFAISGIVQAGKFSKANLAAVLTEVENGKGVPLKYQKLKYKDFVRK